MEARKIHWTQLYGNPLRYGFHPQMLRPEGYTVKTISPIQGESKTEKFPVEIHFDETYVIEKVSRILEELQPQKYNEFQNIVSKAYARWNEKKKQQSQQ